MAKYTPGYEVTRDGRVFSVGSNWRGYGRTSRGAAHSAAIRGSNHAMRVKRGAEHYKTKRRMGHV